MKILHSNVKRGQMKLQMENLDDLWYVSSVVDPGDVVTARTVRKIKIGTGEERKAQVKKKPVTLKLNVDKVEFHKYSNVLRVSGGIVEGPEDVSLGSHHTFTVEPNTILTIHKEEWLQYQLDRIKEASKVAVPKILICVHDREEAFFALLTRQGYRMLSHFEGTVAKKQDEAQVTGNFYADIVTKMKEYVERHSIRQVILASPAFWKEELLKQLKDTGLKKKIVQATCSSADETAINEILRRPEIKEVLKQDRISKEIKLVEDVLTEISKKGAVAYGLKEVTSGVQAGAVKELLVTDTLILDMRKKNTFSSLESLMKDTEKMKGKVHIIDGAHDGGKKLDGLGGIGALLRYKVEY